jgi:hypothetical protein
MLLTENNIKAELSYAYLHAVATRAGLGCEVTGRHSDGAGVDAILRVKEQLVPPPSLIEFIVEIQLKATSQQPVLQDGRYSYALAVDHYNKLRLTECGSPRLLVVLFLPPDPSRWLEHSEEALIARRCAYWVSLYGAPVSENRTSQTIYIPLANVFSVENLRAVLSRFARQERLSYGK